MARYANKKRRGGTQKTSFDSRRFDKDRQIKLKDYKPKATESKKKVLDKKFDGVDEVTKASQNFDPLANINEQYAHDLVLYSMLFQMIANITDASKEAEKQGIQEQLKNQGLADANIEHNLKTYDDFKTNFKFLKIVETKLLDKSLKQADILKLESEKAKVSLKLEELARKFEFKTSDPTKNLKFSSKDELLTFLDKTEKTQLANAYRTTISDLKEIDSINKAPVSKLYDLAVETKDSLNEFEVAAVAKNTDLAINEIQELAKTVASASPVGMVLKG